MRKAYARIIKSGRQIGQRLEEQGKYDGEHGSKD